MKDIQEEIFSDAYFMRKALDLAHQAFEDDEVPIGAIVVCDNKIIGKGYNQTEKLHYKYRSAYNADMTKMAVQGFDGSRKKSDNSIIKTIN